MIECQQNLGSQNSTVSIVSHFAKDLMAFSSEWQLAWYLAQNVVSKMGFVDAIIYLFDEQRNVLVQSAAFGNKNPTEYEILSPIEIQLGKGVVGRAAKTGEIQRINNLAQFPDYIVDDEVRLSELAVPMLADGKLIGVIDSEHPESHFFTDQHEHVLTAIASMAALKIQNLRTIKALHDTVVQMEQDSQIQDTLFEIGELVYKSESKQDFYQLLHGCISKIISAKNFAIAIENKEEGLIEFPYYFDEYDVFENRSIVINEAAPCLTEIVLFNNQPLLLTKAKINSALEKGEFVLNGTIPEAFLGIPFGDEHLRGVVLVQSYQSKDEYKKKDKQVLSFVAKHIHLALKRIQSKSELEFLALHDPLTALPNRTLFFDRVNQALKGLKRIDSSAIAVMFLDLDKFKTINDSYGHNVGDELLIKVSNAIRKIIRDSDTLARLGGDEFALLLKNVSTHAEIESIAAKILEVVKQHVVINGNDFSVSTSIGIATTKDNNVGCERLLIEADEAMYQAKLRGRNQYFIYCEHSNEKKIHTYKIEAEFDLAVSNRSLFIEYQPVVDMHTGKIVGAESLIRWLHPTLGILYPDSFLQDLVKVGKIISLDIYVLEATTDFIQQNCLSQRNNFSVGMNVSGVGFASKEFVKAVESIYQDSPDVLSALIFEVTEQHLIENMRDAQRNMALFKKWGIRIALDDFGTGYSSLSYLHQFNFDYLKIDRSFVLSKSTNKNAAIILKSILNLAGALNIETVVEGIEDANLFTSMQRHKCNYGQGHHIAAPMSDLKLLSLVNKYSDISAVPH